MTGDRPTFRELQERLKDMWPAMTIRELRDVPRTVIVHPFDPDRAPGRAGGR